MIIFMRPSRGDCKGRVGSGHWGQVWLGNLGRGQSFEGRIWGQGALHFMLLHCTALELCGPGMRDNVSLAQDGQRCLTLHWCHCKNPTSWLTGDLWWTGVLLIWVNPSKSGERTGFSKGWQGCSKGFPKGKTIVKPWGGALPAQGKFRPFQFFYSDSHFICNRFPYWPFSN